LGDLAGQFRDAEKFLITHQAKLRELVELLRGERVAVHFGVSWKDQGADSEEFPPGLVAAARACGVALIVSVYLVTEEEVREQ
jgi:hypothetical protein